jgi:hypothetical protein
MGSEDGLTPTKEDLAERVRELEDLVARLVTIVGGVLTSEVAPESKAERTRVMLGLLGEIGKMRKQLAPALHRLGQ